MANRADYLRNSVIVALAGLCLGFTGCSSIQSVPKYSATSARLTPKPERIYVAFFDTETGSWSAGINLNNFPDNNGNAYGGAPVGGSDLIEFKRKFQEDFDSLLRKRLQNIAPVDSIWNVMPTKGWLVRGEFVKVDQGSRFLRTALGAGAGRTTLRTRVYVYDLSISTDKYVLAFETGVPGAEGSGRGPSGVVALGEPLSTVSALSSGLSWDAGQTAVAIEEFLMQYQ